MIANTTKVVDDAVAGLSGIAEEQRKMLVDGEIAHELVSGPAWKLLVDWAEDRCNRSLAAIRKCKSSDERLMAVLVRTWQRDEDWLMALQNYFQGLDEDRESLKASIEAVEQEISGREGLSAAITAAMHEDKQEGS